MYLFLKKHHVGTLQSEGSILNVIQWAIHYGRKSSLTQSMLDVFHPSISYTHLSFGGVAGGAAVDPNRLWTCHQSKSLHVYIDPVH